MAVWVVTVVQCEEDLHKVMPYRVFRDRSAMPLGLLDNGRQIASATVFHEDVKDTRIAIDITVMIAYYVFVMKIFEDITSRMLGERSQE